ncbi:MAG: M23 family metallopeptidase, partial [Ilumatobacteraceae bacterium]
MMAPLAMALGLFAPVCYAPPVSAVITVPYVQPACAYCSGHRGIQYAVATGTPVTAVSDGVVVFAGAVAGTRYVVVLHPDGMRATYGMLASASVRSGEVVHVGQVVGLSAVHLYFG